MTERVPAMLLRVVEADHRPVRPLPPPWQRALALTPACALAAASAPLYWGWRSNLAELGPGLAWGLSGLQAIVGMIVIGAGLREAIPGRTLSRLALLSMTSLAVVVMAGVTLLTAANAPMVVPPGLWIPWAWECLGMAVVSGVPLLGAAGWLVERALPTRPALAGAICGLGVGIVADSGVRLFCWVSDPIHVFVSHGGAVVGLAATGAVATVIVDRLRSRLHRSPEPPSRAIPE